MKKILSLFLVVTVLILLTGCDKTKDKTYIKVVYLDPTDLNKECNASNSISTPEAKSGCMKWYAYSENKDTYTMILDHNTSNSSKWEEAQQNIKEDTSNWDSTLNARLITANEVAQIAGNKEFDQEKSKYTEPVYLSDGKGRELENPSESKYAWMYDYTKDCQKYGCAYADATDVGYWTSNATFDKSGYAWHVQYLGGMLTYNTNNDSGIRPVITISKKLVK